MASDGAVGDRHDQQERRRPAGAGCAPSCPARSAAPSRAPGHGAQRHHREDGPVDVAERGVHDRSGDHERDDREQATSRARASAACRATPPSSGTMMSPPPMPSSPLTNPATSPMPRNIDGVASNAAARSARPRVRAPRRMPTACQASRTAVTTSSRWVSTHVGQRGAGDRPPRCPGPTIHADRAQVDLAGLAVGQGAGERGRQDHRQRCRERDDRRGLQQRPGCPGVITMPPPTPNRPESTPADQSRSPTPSDRLRTRAHRKQVGGAPEHLALAPIGGALQGALEREPAHLLHLVVAVVGVATRASHQEEVHGLADAGVLPHVEVAGVAERGFDLGVVAGLLRTSRTAASSWRLAVLDPALGEPPREVATAGPAGGEHHLDLVALARGRRRRLPRSRAGWGPCPGSGCAPAFFCVRFFLPWRFRRSSLGRRGPP